jgi:hypothetical protein
MFCNLWFVCQLSNDLSLRNHTPENIYFKFYAACAVLLSIDNLHLRYPHKTDRHNIAKNMLKAVLIKHHNLETYEWNVYI